MTALLKKKFFNTKNILITGLILGIIILLFCLGDSLLPQQLKNFNTSAKITLTTPALLFPAISLLLLAYTNRFLVLAQLIRELHLRYQKEPGEIILGQIDNLRHRVYLIKYMQFLGVISFFLCVLCMLLIFFEKNLLANIIFGFSLLMLMGSLGLSIKEIRISVDALDLHLSDLENENKK